MKINNETKVGILTIVAITILILGFNFLKGKKVFSSSKTIYAVFTNIGSLDKSNPVKISGLPVGTVYEFGPLDKEVTGVLVIIHITRDVNIPKNSIAYIDAALVGSAFISIEKGNAAAFLNDGDTVSTRLNPSILSDLRTQLNPTLTRVNDAVDSLKIVLGAINSVFDPSTNNNLQTLIANLMVSSQHLQSLLNSQSSALSHSLSNIEMVTGNLSKSNEQITSTLQNLQTTSTKLANARIQETVAVLEGTINELKTTINKLHSNEGSLGKLMNDSKLYDNLNNAAIGLETLLDDIRVNPKRYVNISFFGRKQKSGPLTSPTVKDTVHLRR